mgnify:CR=1 FL=1
MTDTLLPELLASARKLGLTQQDIARQVAERVGHTVSDQLFSNWKHGKRIPDAVEAIELGRLLGSTVEQMYPR